jgi:hypothetical protein
MKKDLVEKLVLKAGMIAADFSRPDRQFNTNQEVFKVEKILPMSESTAAVFFRKEPTKKLAVAFLYWINGGNGYWQYFFPTDSHVLGMGKIARHLDEVEAENFLKN